MLLDYLILISDCWKYMISYISKWFTIDSDIFNISNGIISFRDKKKYNGYVISKSTNERNRRIVHWFYRNNEIPTLHDWNVCVKSFGLKEIPKHTLQLYNNCNNKTNDYIHVNKITNTFIYYEYVNKEGNITYHTNITVPLGFASLVPDKFIYNISIFNKNK